MQGIIPKKPDSILLFTTVGLLIFGVLMVYDASVVYAYGVFGGKYHFLLRQLAWATLGGVVAAITFFTDYHKLRKLATPLFVVTLAFLVFLIVPRFVPLPIYDKFAPEVNGARRWIVLNPPGVLPAVPLLSRLSFQPSELAKFSLIIYLAAWFSPKTKGRAGKETLLPNLLAVGVPLAVLGGLILLEPAFATATLICLVGIWIYFVAGAPVLPLALSSLALGALGVSFIWSSPYRRARLLTFLNPAQADPLSTGYHLKQILIALGSGGIFGVGLGESRQKYEYLPEAAADSILGIIGEELGFLGTVVVILAFLVLLWRGFLVAKRAKDRFARLLSAGVVAWMSIQILINLCAMTGLIPLTGITLPLVSYGGSSMIFSLAGIGVLLNISAAS